MDGKDIITTVGILLTFSLGIFNLITNNKNGKKTQFINTVTSARIKWIYELRDLVSQFVSYIPFYTSTYIWQNGKERGDYNKNLIEIKEKIKLHLNYNDERDKKILNLIEDIVKLIYRLYEECVEFVENDDDQKVDQLAKIKSEGENIDVSIVKLKPIDLYLDKLNTAIHSYSLMEELRKDIPRLTEQLTGLIQEYLKTEWERVKFESKNGDIYETTDNRKLLKIKDMYHFKDLKYWILLKKIYDLKLVTKMKILSIIFLIMTLILLLS